MEKQETWKPINGFEGLYEISSLARVKSLANKGKGRRLTDKILKISKYTNGYCGVTLSKFGRVKKYLLHRLVAKAFIENPNNKECVNHINANKDDNSVDNLEWVTYSENTLHGLSLGIMNTAKGSEKKNSVLNESKVREIKIRLSNGEIGAKIAKDFNVYKGLIYYIKSGKTWKHVQI